jgi:LuxR family maltose regulon positive regulatory protein
MPRQENKTTPKIMGGVLYNDDGAFSVGSEEWWFWLSHASVTTFYMESNLGTFTARIETRNGSFYWYAFRKHQNKLYKAYIGKTDDLTLARLTQVAEQLDKKISAV